MPEHEEPDAPEVEDELEEAPDPPVTSTTPNLHIPKAKRWNVQNKVVDGETK